MKTQLVVTVSADGSIRVETRGVKGPGCLEQMAHITDLCQGSTVLNSRLTGDYAVSSQEEVVEELRQWD